MQSELQNRINPPAGLSLNLTERLGIPGIDDQRLFADGIGPDSHGKPHMRIVQIIGRTDRDIIHSMALATQFFQVSVKPLELREKMGVRE